MLPIQIDASLQTRIPGVTFGCVTINGVQVREQDEKLWHAIEQLSQRLRREYHVLRYPQTDPKDIESLIQPHAPSDGDHSGAMIPKTSIGSVLSMDGHIAAARRMQKSFGFDPTRYRLSSEALLRRVVQGLEIYQINTVVDVNNWCSLEFLLPMCVYDLSTVKGQISIRVGRPGEEYQGIGRQVFQVNGKVIVTDDEGVMGNTVSDSERTKVTLTTQDIFLMIYAPVGMSAQVIQNYTTLAAQRMVEFNGGLASEALAITV